MPPIACSGIFLVPRCRSKPTTLSTRIVLWHNNSMPRWLFPLVGGFLGVAVGLIYGWIIDPVKFIDTTPASLRADYRTDFVLMVAEAYHANQDAGLAGRRLAIFGAQSPDQISLEALQTARLESFSSDDLALIQELVRALQAAQPIAPAAGSTP